MKAKTKAQLIKELENMRRRIEELEAADTERKRAKAELKNALEGSRQYQKEISALLKSSKAVLEYSEFQVAARAIFDCCKDLLGATAGYVALLSRDGAENEVLFLDSGGLPCDVDPSFQMPIRGLREEAYRTGKAVYDNDFTESQWVEYLPEKHVRLENVLFAPLVIHGKALGLLGLANKPGGFTENDARLASGFGELAAVALHNSRTMELLSDSEERFRSVAQTAVDAIISTNGDGNILFWNRSAETMFGHPAGEVLGKPLTLIIPERFREAHLNGLKRVISTGESKVLGKTLELAGLRRDGGEFPLELSLSAWEMGERIFFAGIARDITERKRAEEELRKHRDHLEELVGERTAELEKSVKKLKREITERQRAEEKLKSSHERFITVMDSLDALVYVADMETYEILFINQFGREIFGDLVGEACWQTLQAGQTGPCAFCSNDKLLTADGEPAGVYEWEFQNTRNDRWYEIRDRAIRWVDGRLVRLEIAIDITERKRAEERLREWASFAELNPAPVLRFDPDGKVIHANPATYQVFGKDKLEDKLIGEILPCMSGIDLGIFIQEGRTETHYDVKVGEKDFQFVCCGVPALGVGHIYGSEITERKRAEEKLSALKALNENVVQSMQDGLVALDRDLRVTIWNKGMEEISGYAAEEVLGQVVLDVFPHLTEQGVDEMLKNALAGEAAERLNVAYQTPKGKEGYTNERYAPLRDHAGEVVGAVAVVEDVTEILRLEQHVASLQEEIRGRKLIDIAKGILMRERGMSISESHNFILKKSRDERLKAGEVARQLIVLLGTPEERKKFTQRNPR